MEVDQPLNDMCLGETALAALEVFDSSGENGNKELLFIKQIFNFSAQIQCLFFVWSVEQNSNRRRKAFVGYDN
jgi:hypothetical protein